MPVIGPKQGIIPYTVGAIADTVIAVCRPSNQGPKGLWKTPPTPEPTIKRAEGLNPCVISSEHRELFHVPQQVKEINGYIKAIAGKTAVATGTAALGAAAIWAAPVYGSAAVGSLLLVNYIGYYKSQQYLEAARLAPEQGREAIVDEIYSLGWILTLGMPFGYVAESLPGNISSLYDRVLGEYSSFEDTLKMVKEGGRHAKIKFAVNRLIHLLPQMSDKEKEEFAEAFLTFSNRLITGNERTDCSHIVRWKLDAIKKIDPDLYTQLLDQLPRLVRS